MNINHTKMTLEINSCKNYEVLEVRQGDKKSRIIDFTFTVNGEIVDLASTMSAKVNATVDDVIVAEDVAAVVDTENNVVTVTLTDTMLALSGLCKMDIVLTEGDEIITAETVCLRIGKKVINGDSKPYVGASSITELMKEIATARGGSNSLGARLDTVNANLAEKADSSELFDVTKSINLANLADYSQHQNGVTITVSKNKISLSGTSTSAVNFYLKLKRAVTLEKGKAYCLSLQNFANITNGGCVFYPANGQTAISSSWLLSEVSAFKNAVATYTATENVTVNSIKVAVATNRLVDNSCNLQLEQNNKKSAYANPDFISERIKPELYQAPDYTMHYLHVSNSYNENTDGFGVTKFNSILSANDSIIDNNYHNRYTIIVAQGTYTDMQDRYAGMSDVGFVGYRGVMMKDYVYYESENIYNPQATIIKWDGATGFDKSTLKSADIIKKCPFHLDSNVHTHIKGFTFDCKNIRYALHLESGGTGYATEWTVANCIFKWGGRADCVDYSGKTTVPALGCGHSFCEIGLIENCKIIPINCTVGYQNHENADNSDFGLSIKTGSSITIRNCDFGNTEIQARTLKGEYSDTPNVLTVDRCVNISEIKKLYAAPADHCDWIVNTINSKNEQN
ncbi:BppU family phage baseplate upper protein [Ruminococcus sp.]|uniref:BppU family phage baseplate upper protein n=1 Tax=Ruminococcus sp. TaxID=41978 RepID=UPI0025ED9276|nr:BppU family phage baseplate upper protein [Ruminococcus sp.]